jgi:membrane protein
VGLKDTVTTRFAELRRRRPAVDHLVLMVQHYGRVKGNVQAGAVTYFAFLSFFPILALAFFVVGWIAQVYPGAQQQLVHAINGVLPGLVGEKPNRISLTTIQNSASTVGLIGLVGVLYSGLGWLSGMRDALLVVFELPEKEQPSFIGGKIRDLITLVIIGVTLMVSVSVSSLVIGLSKTILGWVGLGTALSPVLWLLAVALGLAANALLFYAMFRMLAEPRIPNRSLWSGAILGAVGFEVLKLLSGFLIAQTSKQPAFQAFGIALVLLVWINYFTRVVLYAASWADTSREARAVHDREALEADRSDLNAKELARVELHEAPTTPAARSPRTVFAAGAAAMLGLIAVVRRTQR